MNIGKLCNRRDKESISGFFSFSSAPPHILVSAYLFVGFAVFKAEHLCKDFPLFIWFLPSNSNWGNQTCMFAFFCGCQGWNIKFPCIMKQVEMNGKSLQYVLDKNLCFSHFRHISSTWNRFFSSVFFATKE